MGKKCWQLWFAFQIPPGSILVIANTCMLLTTRTWQQTTTFWAFHHICSHTYTTKMDKSKELQRYCPFLSPFPSLLSFLLVTRRRMRQEKFKGGYDLDCRSTVAHRPNPSMPLFTHANIIKSHELERFNGSDVVHTTLPSILQPPQHYLNAIPCQVAPGAKQSTYRSAACIAIWTSS